MLFLIAFLLGFVGYLPLGNINLTVVQLTLEEEQSRWRAFILFAAIMEFIYCFGCIYGMEILLQQKQLVIYLNWSAVVIFLLLGIFSFLHKPGSTSFSGVKRGILIAIFNPLQIPFWMVWGVYVMENGWVKSTVASIALFSLICSIGTVAVLYIYALAGKKIVERLNVNQTLLNRFIGSFLIFLAVYQTFKLLHHS